VFISYSHADTKWARWLMRRLESYRVPVRFHGRAAPIGRVGARIAPVFRDRDELPTTSDLTETIRAALRDSATLAVICSPASARSRWVEEEILAFKRLHGESRVFAFIVSGEPNHAGAADDCFSPALRRVFVSDETLPPVSAEVVAADARPHADGKEDAFIRLVAGLLGVGFDGLRQRELQRRHRRMTLIAAGAALGMAITLGLAAAAWQARNDARRRQAQAEDLAGFMLGDLRTQLERVGRLDVLEAVGDKAIAYFSALGSRDLNDTVLTSLAKALTQIGEIRTKQKQYPEAARAYSAAYERMAALTARHPRNGEMLYERAQAEFWIGNLHLLRGDLTPAREWLTRYRDSSVALAALDPTNFRWQYEAVMGYGNLAVLESERGNLSAARSGFLEELVRLEKLAAANASDTSLQASIANVISYLGTLAARSGSFPEALERYGHQVRIFEALRRKDPGTARWQDRLANALALQAGVLAITGQRAAATTLRTRAHGLLAALVALDPSNRFEQLAVLKVRLDEAQLLRANGDSPGIQQLLDEVRGGLENLARIEPTDRTITGHLTTTWRLEAEVRHAAGRPDAAAAVGHAIALGEDLMARDRVNDAFVGDFASVCVTAGLIARKAGDDAAALRYWQRAIDVVRARGRDFPDWRLLDPTARALAFLGRGDESRTIIERLHRLGYRPLEPWPGPAQPAPITGSNGTARASLSSSSS
jgi:tetratricopeptide (TPR) repeat protein